MGYQKNANELLHCTEVGKCHMVLGRRVWRPGVLDVGEDAVLVLDLLRMKLVQIT